MDGVALPDGRAHTASTFEIYVDDVRYSVPTLYLIAEADEDTARAAAHARFDESEHHAGVELWHGGRRILALGAASAREESASPLG